MGKDGVSNGVLNLNAVQTVCGTIRIAPPLVVQTIPCAADLRNSINSFLVVIHCY